MVNYFAGSFTSSLAPICCACTYRQLAMKPVQRLLFALVRWCNLLHGTRTLLGSRTWHYQWPDVIRVHVQHMMRLVSVYAKTRTKSIWKKYDLMSFQWFSNIFWNFPFSCAVSIITSEPIWTLAVDFPRQCTRKQLANRAALSSIDPGQLIEFSADLNEKWWWCYALIDRF